MIEKEAGLVSSIITSLLERYPDIIIAIYGIGSYFDENLPNEWLKNDIDIIVVVSSVEPIIKHNHTDVRYEKKEIQNSCIWIGFNSLEGYQDKEKFEQESFSNYEWSLIEIKFKENSTLLHGEDIRGLLPDTVNIKLDYDDILARGLYHLDLCIKSLSKNPKNAMREFTKAVFKLSYYFCVFFDDKYRLTSIYNIRDKIQELVKKEKIDYLMLKMLNMSIAYRIEHEFQEDFKKLISKLIGYIFNLLGSCSLHRKMKYFDLKKYLNKNFGGFSYLIQVLENVKVRSGR